MAMFFRERNKTLLYEGRRLQGDPDDYQMVMNWIEQYGLPRLIDPTPTVEPFTGFRMQDSRGYKFTPGFYINPDKGVLVIRNRYKQVLHADHGDWIFRDTVNNNFFVVKDQMINQLYYPEI